MLKTYTCQVRGRELIAHPAWELYMASPAWEEACHELNDHDAFQLALIENLQRQDLNPLEETESILQLLSGELETTVEEVIAQLYRLENEAKGKVTRNVTGKKTILVKLTP